MKPSSACPRTVLRLGDVRFEVEKLRRSD